MALRWDWNDKMGEIIHENGARINLYQGNAYMIGIVDLPEDQYQLAYFAADKEHLKNMLGLNKGTDNIIKGWGIKTIRLNLKYKTVPDIIALLCKAGLELEIITYKEETNETNQP